MLTARFPMFLPLTMLTFAIAVMASPSRWASTDHDPDLLNKYVGAVSRKCCQPGRRWGCDPKNFRQTGCVHIEQTYPQCWPAPEQTMKCTSANCVDAGPEDSCNVQIRTVGLNRCRPLGNKTTVGCPPDHWQCQVQLLKYTLANAPVKDVFVCDLGNSTICQYNYSACD